MSRDPSIKGGLAIPLRLGVSGGFRGANTFATKGKDSPASVINGRENGQNGRQRLRGNVAGASRASTLYGPMLNGEHTELNFQLQLQSFQNNRCWQKSLGGETCRRNWLP